VEKLREISEFYVLWVVNKNGTAALFSASNASNYIFIKIFKSKQNAHFIQYGCFFLIKVQIGLGNEIFVTFVTLYHCSTVFDLRVCDIIEKA
jgi:hypothetical protein